MQIWKIGQSPEGRDAWVKTDIEPFPTEGKSLIELILARVTSDPDEFWVVFSPEEEEEIPRLVSAFIPEKPADVVLEMLCGPGLEILRLGRQSMNGWGRYVFEDTPVSSHEQPKRLAIPFGKAIVHIEDIAQALR